MSTQPAWSRFLPDATNEKFYLWLPFVVFGLLVALFNAPYLHRFPQGIHEWAQSDRLALAYGFYDHGFNIFKPRTFSLRSIGGVVGPEFPLQAYLVALAGLVVGRAQLSIAFRVLDLLMLTVGCGYLFRLVFAATRNAGLALLPGAFLLSAPLFMYYAGNYLPDPFGISLLFVAFYYLFRFFYQERRLAFLVAGLVLAALATLVKLSLVLYLGPLYFLILLVSYVRPLFMSVREKVVFLLLMVVSLAAIVGWILYMRWLNEEYASWIFIATVKPLKDKAESDYVLWALQEYVVDQYLTGAAYKVLYACVALLLGYALWRWRNVRRFGSYVALLLLVMASIVPYYVLMGPQFAVHDYYSLAPLLPLLILVVVGSLLAANGMLGNRWWLQLVGLVVAIVLIVRGYKEYNARMIYSALPIHTSTWALGGADWLTSNGVPIKDRIMVVGRDDAPNLSLAHFQRYGLVVSDSAEALNSGTILQAMAGSQLRHLVMQGGMYRKVQAVNPTFLDPFKVLVDDKSRLLLAPREPLQGW